MDDMQHRLTDTSLVDRIEKLIGAEPDPVIRTQLLVQLQIANLLIDNIASVRVVADEFKAHRKDYEKHVEDQNIIVNRSWGIWKTVGVLYFGIQGLLGWLFIETVNDYRDLKTVVLQNAAQIQVLKDKKAP